MNQDHTDLQNLLRLKRYEQPDDAYFEDFLSEFQDRQRAEMLQSSSISLLKERVTTWFRSVGMIRLATGSAVAYALVMFGIMAWPSSAPQQSHEHFSQPVSFEQVLPAAEDSLEKEEEKEEQAPLLEEF